MGRRKITSDEDLADDAGTMTVRVSKDLARMIRVICAVRCVRSQSLIDPLIRREIQHAYSEAIRSLSDGLEK